MKILHKGKLYTWDEWLIKFKKESGL